MPPEATEDEAPDPAAPEEQPLLPGGPPGEEPAAPEEEPLLPEEPPDEDPVVPEQQPTVPVAADEEPVLVTDPREEVLVPDEPTFSTAPAEYLPIAKGKRAHQKRRRGRS